MSQELPDGVELPSNFLSVLRRIRRCENEVAAQVVFEHALTAAILADREKQAARVADGYALLMAAGIASQYGVLEEHAFACAERILSLAAPTTEPSKAEQADAPKQRGDCAVCTLGIAGDCYCGPKPLPDEFWTLIENLRCQRTGDPLESAHRALEEYVGDLIHRATQPPASNAGERTPQDFAIEHAEYMAQAAEYLIAAVNDLAKAEQEVEEGAANDSDVDAARENLSENLGSVRNSIYEFRKRRDRAALATKPQAGDVAQDKKGGAK